MLNLCYTGGTTGLPKGVMLSQRDVVSNAEHAVMTFGFAERDIWLHVAPMFHLADAWACYAFTMIGGTHVFMPALRAAALPGDDREAQRHEDDPRADDDQLPRELPGPGELRHEQPRPRCSTAPRRCRSTG